MKMNLWIVVYSVFLTMILSSCNKYADKIAGEYKGSLEINDTIVSEEFEIIISKQSADIIQVSSSSFDSYEVKINKKRYFGSKSFYSVDTEEQLEVYEDGTMNLLHYDKGGTKFTFWGSREL